MRALAQFLFVILGHFGAFRATDLHKTDRKALDGKRPMRPGVVNDDMHHRVRNTRYSYGGSLLSTRLKGQSSKRPLARDVVSVSKNRPLPADSGVAG